MHPANKNKSTITVFKQLFSLLPQRLKVYFYLQILAAFISGFFEVVPVLLFGITISSLSEGEVTNKYILNAHSQFLPWIEPIILFSILLLITSSLLSLFLRFATLTLSSYVNIRQSSFMSKLLFRSLILSSRGIQSGYTKNDLGSIMATYSLHIGSFFDHSFKIVNNVLLLVIYIFGLLSIYGKSTLYILISITLFFITSSFFTKRTLSVFSRNIELGTKNTLSYIETAFDKSRNIYLDGQESSFRRAFMSNDFKIKSAYAYTSFIASVPKPILETIIFVAISLALTYQILSDPIAESIDFAVLSTVGLVLIKSLPLFQGIFLSHSIMRSYKGEVVSVCEFVVTSDSLNLPKSLPKNLEKSQITSIVLENYSVNAGNKPLYHIDYLNIACGKSYLVTGESGSGKTTLIDHLIRYTSNSNSEGSISYLSDLRQVTLCREHIFHMGQDFRIFEGTIAENIAFNFNDFKQKLYIDKAKLYQSIHLASLESLFSHSRTPFNITIGDNGTFALSGGQLQRLFLAKAFYKSLSVTILDEPTASLDHHTSHSIIRNLVQHFNSRILIVVSHDASIRKYFSNHIHIDQSKLFVS